MPIGGRVAAGMIWGGGVVLLAALGGCAGRGERAMASVPDTSEAVRLLRSPDNPYRIIYYQAVDLTKRPDTTKAAPPAPHAPPPARTPAAPKKARG